VYDELYYILDLLERYTELAYYEVCKVTPLDKAAEVLEEFLRGRISEDNVLEVIGFRSVTIQGNNGETIERHFVVEADHPYIVKRLRDSKIIGPDKLGVFVRNTTDEVYNHYVFARAINLKKPLEDYE